MPSDSPFSTPTSNSSAPLLGSFGSGRTPQRRTSSVPRQDAVLDSQLTNAKDWTCDRVFRALDKDNNGYLDAAELALAITAVTGKQASGGDVDKLIKKYDVDKDGKLTAEEFATFVKAAGKKSALKLGIPGLKKKKAVTETVKSSREHIIASERASSSGGDVAASLSSMRELPPLPPLLATTLVSAMRYVESDLSRQGLYRAASNKISTVNKCMVLITECSTGRLTFSEFRKVVGHDTRVVALCIVKLLSSHAPLIPYALFDKLGACETPEAIAAFLEASKPEIAADGTSSGGGTNTKHMDLLGSFMIHLSDLIKFSGMNQMSAGPLAVPLGVLLFRRSEDLDPDPARQLEAHDRVIKTFTMVLESADSLFGERDEFLWGARERPDPKKKNAARARNQSEAPSIKFMRDKKGGISGEPDLLSKEEEVKLVVAAGKANPNPSRWYVVPSRFVHEWLAYTTVEANTLEDKVSPRPEKLDNTTLLLVSPVTNLWYVNEAATKATDGKAGDYRLVNVNTWKTFKSLYPGSGPAIFVDDDDKDDFSEWWVDQAESPHYAALKKEQEEKTELDENDFSDILDPGPIYEQNGGEKGVDVMDAIMYDVAVAFQGFTETVSDFGGSVSELIDGFDLFGGDVPQQKSGYSSMGAAVQVSELQEGGGGGVPEVERKAVKFDDEGGVGEGGMEEGGVEGEGGGAGVEVVAQ